MENFVKMLNMLILKYFHLYSCIHYINDKNDLDINLHHPSLIQTNILKLQDYLELFKCDGFIILSGNVEEYVIIIERYLRYSTTFRYTNRRYLLISGRKINVEEFFGLENFRFIKDAVLVLPRNCSNDFDILKNLNSNSDWDKCEVFDFWTHRYVTNITKMPILLYTWYANSTFPNKIIYPDKISNQMKKDLLVSVVNYMPYANAEKLMGVEFLIIRSFIEYYNFSGVYIPQNDFWGDIYDNYSGYGSKLKTATGITDISLGGFYLFPDKCTYFEVSVLTVKNALGFLVPGPTHRMGLDTPFRPFSTTSWIFFVAFFVIAIGMYSLLIYIYNRYKNEIRTLADLENSDMPIFGISSSDLDKAQNNTKYKSIVSRFHTTYGSDLTKILQKTKHVAITLEHLSAGYTLGTFENDLSVNDIENFRVLKEDLSYDVCVILGYKHSVIFPALNQYILLIKQSGLDYYWMSDAFRDMNYTFRLYFKYEFNQNTVKLNWNSVEGTFLLWACGLCLALIQFAFEIIYK